MDLLIEVGVVFFRKLTVPYFSRGRTHKLNLHNVSNSKYGKLNQRLKKMQLIPTKQNQENGKCYFSETKS